MNFAKIISFFLLLFAVYWSIDSLMPKDEGEAGLRQWNFELTKASKHVENLSKMPHAVGFDAHRNVSDYIVSNLRQIGLEVYSQKGYSASDRGTICQVNNILSRIKGSSKGKALLLLAHYDSSPHSSFGASDNASGVATLLEGVRAFSTDNKLPKNDIIILFTDAEELGLNGAKLFVNEHPWSEDVGLVLNFDARGSGGASYMLIETNRGNSNMVKKFVSANTPFPVANSLVYSLYKTLPNDNDLTVFREDADIEGFNFAFFDDHFDYHTSLDTFERLDQGSLAHHASYLMPLLHFFADDDLDQIKSLNDEVYFNMPFFKLVTYSFDLIWPLFMVACFCFLVLLIHGVRKKALTIKGILMGFLAAVIVLSVNLVAGYISWPSLTWWYPWYNDILQGFTYNGHLYVVEMIFFAIGVCLLTYYKFNEIKKTDLLVAPLFIWLCINGLVVMHLKGASFFIIPVFGLLAGFLVLINQKRPNPLLLLFLALPGIFMYAPFIQMFPIGLGLKMMMATTLFTTLLFFLTLPLLTSFNRFLGLGLTAFLLFAVYGIKAHLNSEFSVENPKPSSLIYVYDDDEQSAQWASYDHELLQWNAQFLNKDDGAIAKGTIDAQDTPYSARFKHTAQAPIKQIAPPEIMTMEDTITAGIRTITICVTPKRPVNRLDVYTENKIIGCTVNGIVLSDYYLRNRKNNKLVTHFISNNAATEIELSLPDEDGITLTIFEASNDLMDNALFSVPERPENSISMPFVVNDAIVMKKTLRFE